jgi:DNA-binding Lrp family transcriptional regulator
VPLARSIRSVANRSVNPAANPTSAKKANADRGVELTNCPTVGRLGVLIGGSHIVSLSYVAYFGRSMRSTSVITAIVLVTAATDSIPEVAQSLADIPGVSEVYSVAGNVDLIALVRVREFDQVADVIAGKINKVHGVLDTDTHIAFRAYSRHDLEAAFAIGFDET